MEYAKLQLIEVRKEAWRMASCRARGAAISLMAYCADMENGGRIVGALSWSNAHWVAMVGVSCKDVGEAMESGLTVWDGEDVVVMIYDNHAQASLNTKRAQGRHGSKGGRPKNPQGSDENNPKGFQKITPIPSHTTPDHPIRSDPTPSEPDHDIGFDGESPDKHPQTWAADRHVILAEIKSSGGNVTKSKADDWQPVWERFGLKAIREDLKTATAAESWPNQCRDRLETKQAFTASPPSIPPVDQEMDNASAVIETKGWRACRDLLGLPETIGNEADLLAALADNRPLARRLVTQ